jgi:hypothetical protein
MAMTLGAHRYVATYASVYAFQDDLEMTYVLDPAGSITTDFLWRPANEHRIPVPKLIYAGLIELTGSFRSGMFFQVWAHAILALAMILVARKLRGRVSFSDAFFPLLWLHQGNGANYMLGMQITISVPTAMAGFILLLIAAGPARPTVRTGLAIGLCLAIMPLCGAFGLGQVPPIVLWLAVCGWMAWRSGRPGSRSAGIAMGAMALLVVSLIALYLYDFHPGRAKPAPVSLATLLATSTKFLSLSLGPAGRDYWPASGILVLGSTAFCAALLAFAFSGRPAERARSAGLLATLASVLLLALAVGYGRSGVNPDAGFSIRYVTMPSPLLCVVYFSAMLYASPWLGGLVRAALFVLLAVALPLNVDHGNQQGRVRKRESDAFAASVAAGKSPEELAMLHWREFYPDGEFFYWHLLRLLRAGLTPFEGRQDSAWPQDFSMLPTRPISARSTRLVAPMRFRDTTVLMVPPKGDVRFEVPAGKRVARGRFGIGPWLHYTGVKGDYPMTGGVRFSVEWIAAGEQPVVLFERALEAHLDKADQGFQSFSVELPAGQAGQLLLKSRNTHGRNWIMDCSFWSDVVIE